MATVVWSRVEQQCFALGKQCLHRAQIVVGAATRKKKREKRCTHVGYACRHFQMNAADLHDTRRHRSGRVGVRNANWRTAGRVPSGCTATGSSSSAAFRSFSQRTRCTRKRRDCRAVGRTSWARRDRPTSGTRSPNTSRSTYVIIGEGIRYISGTSRRRAAYDMQYDVTNSASKISVTFAVAVQCSAASCVSRTKRRKSHGPTPSPSSTSP